MISKIKGTQDFLNLVLFNFIIDQIKKELALYHFSEIATPILEPVDLIKRSLGVQTDVVTKEMFVIETGPDSTQICLRPEATASTVRAFVENAVQITPWKVFSYGPMFRHERPQKGRYRQFHQVNIEVIGSKAIMQDVQLIKMLDRLFSERFKLSSYALHLNFLGCFEDRKAHRVLLKEFLNGETALEVCSTCKVRREKNIMRVFDCKNVACQKIYANAPFISDNLCQFCADEWRELQEALELLSVSFVVRPTLVRGLDYYNKTVFEFVSANLGAQNAFCGGGRYDQLVGQIGGKEDKPSVGAAIGIERVMLLLEPIKDSLPLSQEPALHVILPMSEKQQMLGLLLADQLQAYGLTTDILLTGNAIKKMMAKANNLGALYALIIGEQDQQDKTVMVKNMITGDQEVIPQIDVVDYLKK